MDGGATRPLHEKGDPDGPTHPNRRVLMGAVRAALRLLAAVGDRLLSTDLSTIPPLLATGRHELAVPAHDWGVAVGAVASRTGSSRAVAELALTDALTVLAALAEDPADTATRAR